MPDEVTGDPDTENPVGTASATLDTVPLADPAPIAVRKLPASSAEIELSALICKNVTAPGFANVKIFDPTVVAPRFVRAPTAVVAPEPPLSSARGCDNVRLFAVVVPSVLVPTKVALPPTANVPVFVILAFVVEAFTVVNSARVPFRLVKAIVPVNVGEADNTKLPVPVTPVTSMMRASSSALVSSEELEILPTKVDQSAAVRRPRAVDETLGILRVAVLPRDTGEVDQLMSDPVLVVAKEIVEFARPELPRAPVIVGLNVMVLPVAVIVSAFARPLNEPVVVASKIDGPV